MSKTVLLVIQCSLYQRCDFIVAERLELKHLASTYQRAINRKERIRSRGSDQRNDSVFNVSQQRVLLRFVETMNLIDEQQCTAAT